MSQFYTRLLSERSELRQRLEDLNIFIASEEFEALVDADREDLKAQRNHMDSYSEVLDRRAARLAARV
jgi:hypothetical protein